MNLSQSSKPKLLVLLGPTAVGKTKLSLEIAMQYNCEIISGDSMQVYRGMDVGTAKVTKEELNAVPHHLIDILDPDEPFSVSEFQEKAKAAIADITSRNKLPFVVGGTGLYIESLCYEFQFSEGGMDEEFRQEQKALAEMYGEQALHDKLKEIDPESADRIHPNDQRRTIRALEIYHLTGETLSEQLKRQVKTSPFDLCIIGLTMDRQLLYERIELRIDEMIRQGLVEEVRGLLAQGYSRNLVSMQGLGYKEIIGYLFGEYTLEEAVAILKQSTRRFAKRQLSWFRHMKDVQWVDVSDTVNFSAHLAAINDIIAGKLHLQQEYK